MKKAEAVAKIKELTGIVTNNGNIRAVISNTMGVFESEIKKGTDFYFIPVVKIGKNGEPDVMYHNRVEVWKLSADRMLNYDNDPEVTTKHGSNYVKYIFPMSATEIVYPVRDLMEERYAEDTEFEEVDNEFPLDKRATLTEKDRVCIDLRVPKADAEWVNELIKDSVKQRIKLLTILLEKL